MKIVGISGSGRKGSFNTALLNTSLEFLPEGVTMEIVDVSHFPLFNEDIELSPPDEVRDFKRKVREADAVLFATPEYNFSVSAILKNAIEWGNHPDGDNAWEGKPGGMVSASTGPRGGARAQLHLRQIMADLDMHAFNSPQVYVGRAQEVVKDGKVTDERVRNSLKKLVEALVEWTNRLGAG